MKWKSAIAAAFLLATGVGMAATEMSVQIRQGQVRDKPSFLGKILANLNYGSRVQVLQQQGDWSKVVLSGGGEGWMHGSALTKKKVVMQAGGQDAQVAASGEELALAGKGFNQQVEAEFKERNPSVDFKWVDWMEKSVFSPEDILAFLRAGGVGGAP